MEQNLPLIAKRLWGIVRVVFFMLRKNISKRKFLLDLNMMLKRGKLASKALVSNLMFHHHHHFTGAGGRHHNQPSNLSFASGREYEFSCSNTPSYPFSLSSSNKHRRSHINYNFFACAHAPPTLDDDPAATAHALKAVLDLLNNSNDVVLDAAVASPALPGFGKSPLVRQLRITDSPFPLKSGDDGDDGHVDKAAEEFIKRFYKDLKSQRGE